MRERRRTALLFGGRSGEHEVSLQSATSILRNIDLERNSVILIGIEKSGTWRLQSDEWIERVRSSNAALEVDSDRPRIYAIPSGGLHVENGKHVPVDVVFPVLHGTFGEDGTVQGYLECGGLAYVGAGVAGSSIGFDKALAKALWMQAGLPCVPYVSVELPPTGLDDGMRAEIERRTRNEFGRATVFVKPARGGSSVGVSRAETSDELANAVHHASRFDYKLVIEPAIDAREVECSVTGNSSPRAWAIGEIVPRYGFYDYRAKYLDDDGAALIVPAELDQDTSTRIRDTAVRAYRAVDCSGLARIDFFVDDRKGEILLNEINTIPGFTRISMFPVLCREHGLSYPELIDEVINLAIEQKARLDSLEYEYPAEGGE